MSRGVKKWSEDHILKLQRAGRGQGRLASYIPWVWITDFYSKGRTHEVWGRKTGRTHQLLSDGEHHAFLLLQWAPDVVDIREQYPLDRDITREIAKSLDIRHPAYPGTHVPTVMTLDFLVTKVVNGSEAFEAFSVKTSEDLENRATVEKLEIERSSCEALGVPFRLLVKELLPLQKARTLKWIEDGELKELEPEPWEGFYADHMARMLHDIPMRRFDGALNDYCLEYDRRNSLTPGTALRVARMLLTHRAVNIDLNSAAPWQTPMGCVHLSALPGQLRSANGVHA
jgi:hypothetical protein